METLCHLKMMKTVKNNCFSLLLWAILLAEYFPHLLSFMFLFSPFAAPLHSSCAGFFLTQFRMGPALCGRVVWERVGETTSGRPQLPFGFVVLNNFTTSVFSFAVETQLRVWHPAVSVAPAKPRGRLWLGPRALSQRFLDKVFRFGMYPAKPQLSYPQNILGMFT